MLAGHGSCNPPHLSGTQGCPDTVCWQLCRAEMPPTGARGHSMQQPAGKGHAAGCSRTFQHATAAIGLHQVQGKRRLLRTPSHLLGVVIGVREVGVHNQLWAVGLDHCGRALCAEDMG